MLKKLWPGATLIVLAGVFMSAAVLLQYYLPKHAKYPSGTFDAANFSDSSVPAYVQFAGSSFRFSLATGLLTGLAITSTIIGFGIFARLLAKKMKTECPSKTTSFRWPLTFIAFIVFLGISVFCALTAVLYSDFSILTLDNRDTARNELITWIRFRSEIGVVLGVTSVITMDALASLIATKMPRLLLPAHKHA